MKHYGDITKISGRDITIVDIVCGGSPCQDLSVAGKREGLAGERSGLFMEQIRLIKEMRESDRANGRATINIRPRYMVWENVPGAFSSNKGEDFREVLEETAKVAERDACIPGSPNGKWPHSGCIMGDGWSIAWRVHDAQFWGVPQRRKRIALVADFGGDTAPEILFERKGLSGDTEQGEQTRQETTETVGRGANPSSYTCTSESEKVQTLKARDYKDPQCVVYGISAYDSNAMKSSNPNSGIYEADTTRTLDNNGGNPACNQGGMMVVQGFDGYNQQSTGDVAMPLRSKSADSDHVPIVCLDGNGSRPSHKGDGYVESDTMYTLNSTEHHAVCVENHPADSRVQIKEDGVVQTLSGRMGTGGGNVPMEMESSNGDIAGTLYANEAYDKWSESEKSASLRASGGVYGGGSESLSVGSVVRRLTPLECERLQGYPDGWTNIGEWYDSKGKKHKGESDSPRYKALGNSIALPFWQWMAERMCKYIENPTMASLFDGIGGFPLVYSRCGCVPVWASEIEEFPIAVTKIRFPEGSECN